MQNTIMTVFVIHNPLSFPQSKCFRTFAVWKHFSIYLYPQIGSHYLVKQRHTPKQETLDISRERKRKKKPWFSRKYYASVMNLRAMSFVHKTR